MYKIVLTCVLFSFASLSANSTCSNKSAILPCNSTAQADSKIVTKENKKFCEVLSSSIPVIYKSGNDTFAIRDGKRSSCETHSKDEWQVIATSPQFGMVMGMVVAYENNDCAYNRIVEKAIASQSFDVDNLKEVIRTTDIKDCARNN